MSSGPKRKAAVPLFFFFHVGTNDAAKGNLENIKSDCRALGAKGRGMRASQRCGGLAHMTGVL